MSRPLIKLTSRFGVPLPSGFVDLTALTGGSAQWNPSPNAFLPNAIVDQGNQAAWWCAVQTSNPDKIGIWKAATGDALVCKTFGTFTGFTGTGNNGSSIYTDTYDTSESQALNAPNMLQYNFSGIDCGLEWTAPANELYRLLHWYGQTYGGGWQAEASLVDGSAADPTPIALPTTNFVNSSFDLEWLGKSPNYIKFRVARRSGSGAAGIQAAWCYYGGPTLPRRQGR